MNEVILIEDRPGRQSQFLSKNEIDNLNEIEGLTVSKTLETSEVILNINNGHFDDLKKYKLIIIHRSALADTGINGLNKFCKLTKKDLIYFSGGINQSNYYNDGYDLLNSSVSELYNKSLGVFLKDYIEGNSKHLLEILFGKSWQLSTMLCYRQWLTFNPSAGDSEKRGEYVSILANDYSLDELNKIINKKFAIL